MTGRDPHLHAFVSAAPRIERTGLRVLLALARRPRGARVLHRLAPADQLANGIASMGHFEDPAVAMSLGWDADAVASRGRALRREEGRP
ncbi:MAG TPA: hypothetical protein VK506_11790 [Conexibacter sp.]|nr:hypothetical protein [Conexibacter sp.]